MEVVKLHVAPPGQSSCTGITWSRPPRHQTWVPRGTQVFFTDKNILLPSPKWQTATTLSDTNKKNLLCDPLQPRLIRALLEIDQGWGKEHLENVVRLYPKVPPSLKLPTCELPNFSGQDFSSFVDKFARFLRLSGLQHISDQFKIDWLIQACEPQVYKIVVNTFKQSEGDLETSLTTLGDIFPTLEKDLKLRKKIEALLPLPCGPEPPQVATFLLEFENLAHKLTANAWTDQDKLLALISKIHQKRSKKFVKIQF